MPLLSVPKLADLCRMAEPSVRKWIAALEPSDLRARGGGKQYESDQALDAIYRGKFGIDRSSSGPLTPVDARTMKDEEMARFTQVRRLEAEGTLIQADEVLADWSDQVVRFRTRMMDIPKKLARELAAAETPHEAAALLDEQIRYALSAFKTEDGGGDGESQRAA